MTKKYISLKEETRTVSGFSEFVHNGKTSIMENDDDKKEITFDKSKLSNFSQEKNILIQKYKGNLNSFLESLNNLNLPNNICINSFKHILSIHKDNIGIPNTIVPLVIRNIDNEKETQKIIGLGCIFLTKDKHTYLCLSQINSNGDTQQVFYNNTLNILLKKNLVKIENINLLVDEDIVNENYIPEDFEVSNDNEFIYYSTNQFYVKKETNTPQRRKTSDNTSNQENGRKDDEIENDNSTLTYIEDKKKNKSKEKEKSITTKDAIKKGVEQGWDSASSNKGLLKTIRDTYKTVVNTRKGWD